MSLPPINPPKSVSGIAVDPRTQQRVVPQTRRADGSLRKELKIRQGFTPQEDVSRFRSTKQQQMEANALPKGHILGWIAPSGAGKKSTPGASSDGTGKPLTKAQLKNAKRREKKREEKEEVKENWDDEEEDETGAGGANGKSAGASPTSEQQASNVDALAKQLEEKVKVG